MPLPPNPPRRWIDFHVHFFPDRLFEAIRAWFAKNAGWDFPFRGTWREGVEYLEGMEGLERYVCFGYAHKPGIARELNRFYADLLRVSPKAVALGAVHQEDENLADLAAEALDLGLRGFKIHCQVQGADPADPRFRPLYETAQKRGAFVLFHAGTGPFPSAHTGFDRFRPVLERFPGLRCVAAHLGAFEADRFLSAALQYENLYLDTAYTFIANPLNRMDAPLDLLKKASGKVLFATDFPGICHAYEDGVRAIAELPLRPEEREAVFRGNALRFLGI